MLHVMVWGIFFCQAQTESPRIFFEGKVLDPAGAARAGAANPQSQERATLSGTVLDPSDAVIPDVQVDLLNQATGSLRTAFTDHSGKFLFTGLEPSSYTLEIRRNNFKTLRRDVVFTSGENMQLPLTLEIAPAYTFYERVMVIGDPIELGKIPGSAQLVGGRELAQKKVGFDDIHQFLRHVPGVNIQEEEGYGLRPNIGMRGSGTERSATITLMEDGVLVAPAPYAAPAAYYFPTPGRMESIEIREGSSQIKYGPRTNGGALNLISTSIPESLRLGANVTLGPDSTRKLHANLGDSHRNFAWLAETYQFSTLGFKRLDGGGDTGFDLEDYVLKFRLNTGSASKMYQQVEIKLGYTDQRSDETYLGLSEQDFLEDPFRRYAGSQADIFNSDHKQYQAQHLIVLSSRSDLTTTVYRNDFRRNWYKLNDVNGRSIGDILARPEDFPAEFEIIRGADTANGALRVRANNRSYYSYGVQSILGLRFDRAATRNEFEIGIRFHTDQEDRFQHDDRYRMSGGRMILTKGGAPGSNANRLSDAKAWAFFVQDEISAGRWTFTPGLRYENIEVVRTDFAPTDPARTAPTLVRSNTVGVLIPGVGVTFHLSPAIGFFGGVHKGFAPPGPGSTEETDAESSVNYEIGVRSQHGAFEAQLAGFFNDYANLLGRDTLSSGGSGSGLLFNGGKARIYGVESSFRYDLRRFWNTNYSLPVRFSYTFTDAEFRSSFASEFEPWGTVVFGDGLPYVPRHQLDAAIGFHRSNWSLELESNYMGAMRTQAGSGPIPRLLSTDAHWVLNTTAEYGLTEGARLFVAVQNLTDNKYVVARHPAGARPGLPRTFTGGIRFNLGL
ncbi:MAG: TonB-dependent receptor [Acidobacteria bacterium]|nr:TonB-dependent receptor [Acidobacteriota bacterium]